MELTKTLRLPLDEGLENSSDLPHTISLAVTYRSRINSFYELPEDKRPPRDLWDKPTALQEYFDDVFDTHKGSGNRKEAYLEYDMEEVD